MGSIISKFVFQPPQGDTYDKNYPFPITAITTESGFRIPIHFLKSKNPKEKRTIIYSHGNGSDLGTAFEFIRSLRDTLNYNILHYEYFGYGLLSDYSPSEHGVYECADAAMQYLLKQCNLDQQDIILYGTSLGSAPTIYLAAKYRRCAGVILESPFTSVITIITNFFALRVIDMFENYARIGAVQCPVLIFHGTEDEVVPIEHGKLLLQSAKKKFPGQWIEGANHNNLREKIGKERYFSILKEYFKSLGENSPPESNEQCSE